MFTSGLFLVSLFLFHTFSTGLEKPWLDDIDGPKFLRGAEQQKEEEKDLDFINDLPRDWSGVVSDNNVIFASSKGESMVCKVAAAPEGVNTTTWNSNSIPISLKYTYGFCGPYPTMVKLPRAPGEIPLLTSHVILHRCVGNCVQDAWNCTVKSQEEIKYSVANVKGMKKTITVYNHTKCACNCKTRASDCDQTIQNFNKDSCSCKCRLNKSHCSVNHVWSERSCQCQCNNFCSYPHFLNTTTCQCQCINPPACDTTVNQFLNDQTCECDCPQNVKKRCARKGKVLNKQRCECECPTPRPTCGPGTSFLRYNCTCV